MRILGVDPGEKRIGLALGDPLGLTASGLKVISFSNLKQALAEIAALCLKYQVEQIVVGHPLNMDGSCGPAAQRALSLARRLKAATGLKVYLFDERLTTARATKTLIEGGVSRKKRRQVQDKLAAAYILEAFMQAEKNKINEV